MKKSLILFLFGLLALSGCGKLISSEGSWLCADQGWVKQGNPSTPMPNEKCESQVRVSSEDKTEPASDTRTEVEANIKVTSPSPNERVGSPFTIKGEARVFENQLNWKLKGADGSVISEGMGTANAPDMGQFGPFETEVSYSLPQGTSGILEVFDYSAKDGAVQDLVSIPVSLGATPIASVPETPSVDEIAIKIYFANSKLDPEMTCEKVFAAERIVSKAKTMARVAVEELLKGPTEAEKDQGFSTTINPNVKINRLVIVDGVAQVDFDSTLEYQVGGSCRVGIIRRQIEETLKQFPSVQKVVISIEGRTEDILQP